MGTNERNNAQIKIINGNYGISAGLSLSVGTHINHAGVFFRSYTQLADHLEWNNELRLSYFYRNLGPKKHYPELQFSTALLFGYGPRDIKINYFASKISNLTGYKNSIAYAFNLYFNTIKTNQQTGSIMFSFGDFYIIHENDLLARPILDRFRTAGIQLAYCYQQFRFAVTQYNWTGMLGNHIKDSLYPSPAGYLDTTGHRYGLLSHGILCLSAEYYQAEFNQQMKFAAGIDAEQVRNFIQNKVVHDGCIFPEKWRNKNNYHFPMIDSKGEQYLFRNGQKIKRPKTYVNTFLNPDLIY